MKSSIFGQDTSFNDVFLCQQVCPHYNAVGLWMPILIWQGGVLVYIYYSSVLQLKKKGYLFLNFSNGPISHLALQ